MSSRYAGRKIVRNVSKIYEKMINKKGVQHIDQYKTPRLKHPAAAERATLTRVKHVWKVGDRYWKLSSEHYGTPKYWWVIGWYNQKPTENMLNVGDSIIIPKPLEQVLDLLRYY
tara:strand:- start:149 stop:490 length:342 start_codon:yes stop_codon:yes gene_type:complete